ncbi:MAG: DUF169 domain-containing protein [Spirochaetes bacterium]|nr:DUF169 domain-containing protein [Spirochaetota bacterium]
MDMKLKESFLEKWKTYFGDSELPIICYYSDRPVADVEQVKPSSQWSCLICELARVRKGESLSYDGSALGCGGAKRYLGYTDQARPKFEYFLSCGIPGEMEGERYLRTPEMVRELQKHHKRLPVEGKNIIFKRWDKLIGSDNPEIVIFFATPDVLSGLFTLANYDQTEPNSSIAPFGAGCGSIIHYPYFEKDAPRPRAVIGMFDPSARPCVPENTLTFSVPMLKFVKMIGYMDESFLITDTWKKVRKRILQGGCR